MPLSRNKMGVPQNGKHEVILIEAVADNSRPVTNLKYLLI